MAAAATPGALYRGLSLLTFLLLLYAVLIQGFTDPVDASSLQVISKAWSKALSSNWSGSDPCASQWQGISCSNGSVIGLDLSAKGIQGSLPAAIGSLSNLRSLSLQKNDLRGTIPGEIGNLSKLTVLKLAVNGFSGSLPGTINRLSNLQVLSLHRNALTGPLPDLSNLTRLTDLFLQLNNFNGSLPAAIGSFRSLRTLMVSYNQFNGHVPNTITQLSYLSTLYIDHNMLTGPFPNISGLKSLQYLWMQNNKLSGPIPPELGDLSSLQNLGLENNHFSGSIPPSIIQLSSLPYLFLQNNDLSGPVPDLSALINLQGMSLTNNSFDLQRLPSWASTLQNLQLMYLDNCSLTGVFPSDIVFGMKALTQARFDNNRFNGTLDISNVAKNLTILSLENNRITGLNGAVPFSLQLFLGGNPLCDDPSFPSPNLCEMAEDRGPKTWTWHLQCPAQKCQPDHAISPVTCNCTYPIESVIQLSATPFNSLTAPRIGFIERQLASGLQLSLDRVKITNANFTNKAQVTARLLCFPVASGIWRHSKVRSIEEQLQSGKSLLTGAGVFKLQSLQLPKGNVRKPTVNVRLILALVIPAFILTTALISGLWWWRAEQARKRTLKYGLQQEFAKHSLKPTFFQYQVLKLATHDFDTSYKLGEGGFGKVYKGVLPNGLQIAVKRLYPSRVQQGTEEFVNEVSIITAVLHRNLVKLHGCCIEEDERILVYEFVENNSLSHVLFDPGAPVLDWQRRVEIAVGTARGMTYLHEDCETRIIHRDIKASNILLDKNHQPKIADFGLARLFPEDASHVSTRVAGTFGYVAPEYGLYGQLTEKADVFSFGVLLLELVTGRKSIIIQEDVVLLAEMAWHWFSEGRVMDLADRRLNGDLNQEEFRRMVQVGLVCTQANPLRRPRMSHVVTMLLGEREVDEVPTTPSVLSEILGKSYSSDDKSLLSQSSSVLARF